MAAAYAVASHMVLARFLPGSGVEPPMLPKEVARSRHIPRACLPPKLQRSIFTADNAAAKGTMGWMKWTELKIKEHIKGPFGRSLLQRIPELDE